MKNIKLTLEFDGTDFHGWQKQPGVRTVQGTLEDAVEELFGEPITVTGCGRTDAGVHAWGFVCNFLADTDLLAAQIGPGLSARLPDDVVVREIEEVGADFHSRSHAVARRYGYRISAQKTAINRRVSHHTRYRLDVDMMSTAASALVGRRDFTSFAATGSVEDVSPVCEVEFARFGRDGSDISFEIKADRFLYRMVRNIVGTLIEVGRGRISPEQIGDILCKKDRAAAGPTAPACGLSLIEVYYRG
jgi:tRNA pseudouridine38-40 synthase